MPTDIRFIGRMSSSEQPRKGESIPPGRRKYSRESHWPRPSLVTSTSSSILEKRNQRWTWPNIWELAAELHKHREAFSRKTAVLGPPERSDYAGFFALCAQERGFDVRAFTHLGDAMEWLDQTDA